MEKQESKPGSFSQAPMLILGGAIMLILAYIMVKDERGSGWVLFLLFVVIPAVLYFYFLPTVVANRRNHVNATAIFTLNLLLGWMLIPWVIALVWAYKKESAVATAPETPVIQDSPFKKCPYCAEEVRIEAIKCKHCQSGL